MPITADFNPKIKASLRKSCRSRGGSFLLLRSKKRRHSRRKNAAEYGEKACSDVQKVTGGKFLCVRDRRKDAAGGGGRI